MIDFALRRTHGIDAGLKVARASYLAGFDGTSNVLAGKLYGLPFYGTMAHSFIESFDDEEAAFAAYAETFPDDTALLIDTYDTLAGARRAAHIGQQLRQRGHQLRGVRLDSGDLLALSRETRAILNAAGLTDVRIYASGGLNEQKVAHLLTAGAPIDVFGVGTDMGVSADAPSLDMAYKLVEYAGTPRLKLSTKKVSLARQEASLSRDGCGRELPARYYCVARRASRGSRSGSSTRARHSPLHPRHGWTGNGCRLNRHCPESRALFLAEFGKLPDSYKQLQEPERYPVTLSPQLARFQEHAVARLQARYSSSNRFDSERRERRKINVNKNTRKR